MVDYNLFEKILKSEDCGYIESNDFISYNLMELFASSKAEKVKSLFKKEGVTCYFDVELKCEMCGNLFVVNMNKTKLFEYISHLRRRSYIYNHIHILCPNCKKIKEEQEKEENQKEAQEWRQRIVDSTNRFIESYLNPNVIWKNNVPSWKKIEEIRQVPVNSEVVSNYIKNMDYNDFLNTPYWKAIAERVKFRAKNKCQMCNSNENLNVHHRTYDNHGNELNHMEDLICLCKNCHTKYHF